MLKSEVIDCSHKVVRGKHINGKNTFCPKCAFGPSIEDPKKLQGLITREGKFEYKKPINIPSDEEIDKYINVMDKMKANNFYVLPKSDKIDFIANPKPFWAGNEIETKPYVVMNEEMIKKDEELTNRYTLRYNKDE